MNNSIRFSDIYLVALLVTVFMMWGFVDASGTHESITPPSGWSGFIDIKNTCYDYNKFRKLDLSCRVNRDEQFISPYFGIQDKSLQRISKMDQANYLPKQ